METAIPVKIGDLLETLPQLQVALTQEAKSKAMETTRGKPPEGATLEVAEAAPDLAEIMSKGAKATPEGT